MPILPALAAQLQCLFPATDKGQERWRWFMLTLQAILVPITASRTSNLLRAITTLFGVQIGQSPYYAFMASVKLHWTGVWEVLWRAIPDPLTAGRIPLMIEAAQRLKADFPEADVRLRLGKVFQVTSRFSVFAEGEYDTNTRWEWTSGAKYFLSKRWSLISQYHSDHGLGAGLNFRF